MDFVDSPEQAKFRAEARAWIARHAPHELYEVLKLASFGDAILESPEMIAASKAWQKRKQAGGWACIHWPHEYGGRAATPIEQVIWQEEEGVYGLQGKIVMLGQGMCAPTLIAWATEEQKRRFLPKLASTEEIWCQLFSEPAAGSDLAGLRTRAERRDGGWLINGAGNALCSGASLRPGDSENTGAADASSTTPFIYVLRIGLICNTQSNGDGDERFHPALVGRQMDCADTDEALACREIRADCQWRALHSRRGVTSRRPPQHRVLL